MADASYVLADLQGITIPRLVTPYPAQRNHHYESVRDDFHRWLPSLGLLSEDELRQVTAYDFPLFASLLWPHAEARRLRDLAAVVFALTVRDDELEANRYADSRAAILSSLTDARTGYNDPAEGRWGPLFALLWRSMAEYVPAGQMDRLAEAAAVALQGCLAVADRFAAHEDFRDLDDYLTLRAATIGHRVLLNCIEISRRIDMHGLLESPGLGELLACDAKLHMLIDGIHTLRKDLATGECDENMVLVIARQNRAPLKEAIATALSMFEETVARHEELAAALRSSALGGRPEVHLFLEGLTDAVAGSISYTSCSQRYRTS